MVLEYPYGRVGCSGGTRGVLVGLPRAHRIVQYNNAAIHKEKLIKAVKSLDGEKAVVPAPIRPSGLAHICAPRLRGDSPTSAPGLRRRLRRDFAG